MLITQDAFLCGALSFFRLFQGAKNPKPRSKLALGIVAAKYFDNNLNFITGRFVPSRGGTAPSTMFGLRLRVSPTPIFFASALPDAHGTQVAATHLVGAGKGG